MATHYGVMDDVKKAKRRIPKPHETYSLRDQPTQYGTIDDARNAFDPSPRGSKESRSLRETAGPTQYGTIDDARVTFDVGEPGTTGVPRRSTVSARVYPSPAGAPIVEAGGHYGTPPTSSRGSQGSPAAQPRATVASATARRKAGGSLVEAGGHYGAMAGGSNPSSASSSPRSQRPLRPNLPPPAARNANSASGQASPTTTANEPRYIVVCAYEAETSKEISLAIGDRVLVVKKDAAGWWKGRNLRTQIAGWFPGEFLELDADDSLPEAHHVSGSRPSEQDGRLRRSKSASSGLQPSAAPKPLPKAPVRSPRDARSPVPLRLPAVGRPAVAAGDTLRSYGPLAALTKLPSRAVAVAANQRDTPSSTANALLSPRALNHGTGPRKPVPAGGSARPHPPKGGSGVPPNRAPGRAYPTRAAVLPGVGRRRGGGVPYLPRGPVDQSAGSSYSPLASVPRRPGVVAGRGRPTPSPPQPVSSQGSSYVALKQVAKPAGKGNSAPVGHGLTYDTEDSQYNLLKAVPSNSDDFAVELLDD